MPNKNNSIFKNYDAGDMHDIASMSECDMQWMNTAISHIRREIIKLNKSVKAGEKVTQHHLIDLIHHVDMYKYLADNRLAYHVEEAERYSKEWEQLKGGRNA
jgi:hypothetical protein